MVANTTPLPYPSQPSSPQSDQRGLIVDIQKQLLVLSETSFTTAFDTLGLWALLVRVKYAPALHCGAGNPDSGCIVLNGRVLFDSKRVLTCLPAIAGSVFCFYALPTLSVAQNIAFGLQHLPKPQRDRQVNEQLARVQMQDWKPLSTSGVGGQQQRVALASFNNQSSPAR